MAAWTKWTKDQLTAIILGAVLLAALAAGGVAELATTGQARGEEHPVLAETVPAQSAEASFTVEVVRKAAPLPMAGKKVLIYHTHTWEAFEQVQGALYEETEKWRSKDNTVNMVAVGNALTAALEALGCQVVHDDTAFEPPDLSTAYQRSLAMLEERLAAGESYDLYIDLHRDAVAAASTIKRTVNAGGEEIARFMVLVGKGQGYDVKPNWEANLALAEKLTRSLNGQIDGLCRDVKIKTGRFNQHIAPQCLLIECGLNYNTLEEVLRGIPYLAQAIMDTLQE